VYFAKVLAMYRVSVARFATALASRLITHPFDDGGLVQVPENQHIPDA